MPGLAADALPWALPALAGAAAAAHAFRALTLDRIVEHSEEAFFSPRVPEALDGYRIALVTDVHGIGDGKLERAARRLSAGGVGLLLLGGDFHRDAERAARSIGILAGVRAADGIFAVEGNHDSRDALFPAMRANGIAPLLNSGARVRDGLFLGGASDPRAFPPEPSAAQAVSGAAPGDFVLLLSHNPDIAMSQPTAGIDLILSGHTHGGHVALFGLWAPALSLSKAVTSHGRRFMSGWARSRDGVPVFVSRGIGGCYPRAFARPQAAVVTLRRGPESRSEPRGGRRRGAGPSRPRKQPPAAP